MKTDTVTTSLYKRYTQHIVPQLADELGIKNRHAVPRLERVVINTGIGKISQRPSFEEKILPGIIGDLAALSGQKPAPRAAKKSIAGFKLRQGQIVGLATTLRGKRMYDFIEKVTAIVLPRVRDFRGIDLKNVDRSGNLNLGLRDQFVFPEISADVSNTEFGIQITLVTQARSRDEALALYRKLGFMFKKKKN
jgi:large subunit ribosomal protein L5